MSSNNNNCLKPMFAYCGGKRNEMKTIKKHVPVFKKYCEPFFGGGAVYFMLGIDKPSCINDANKSLVAFYKMIKKGQSQRIVDFLNKAPRTKHTFNLVKKYNYTSGNRFIYLLLNTYRCTWITNKYGKFNGSYYHKEKSYNATIKALNNDAYREQLQNATITCDDFETVMNNNNDEDTFIFLDPPYHKTIGYATKFGDAEQIRLADTFKKSKSKCLMIINKTELTAELYKGYIAEEYTKKYVINNCTKITIHIVVKNY